MSTGLSPNDIRNYEFPNQMRGYDKDEVREFLQQVAVALEDLKQENLKLSMERDSVRTQLEALKQFEDTIKSAAIDARRNADSLVANAKKEVGEILNKARMEAEKTVGSRAEEARRLDEQITKLRMIKTSYQTKLKDLIESHIELIDEIQKCKAPDTPKIEPPAKTATASADDTARTPVVDEAADNDASADTPAASKQEDSSTSEVSLEPEPSGLDTPLDADWVKAAREANILIADPPGLQQPSQPTNGLDVEEVTEVTTKRRETFSSEPEPVEPERTEEANAAEQIVAVGPAPDPPPIPEPEPPIDPELAAALESYQAAHGTAPELSRKQPLAADQPDANDNEQRDESMRATPNDFDDRYKTGKVETQPDLDQPGNTEHNLIDIDEPIGETNPEPTIPPSQRKPGGTKKNASSDDAAPDDIARELDEVAARFEEEMDKAARS